jgi:Tol biopolymer transport system component
MNSTPRSLLALAAAVALSPAAPGQVTVRLNLSSEEIQAAGETSGLTWPGATDVAELGRHVSFASDAANLVSDDTNVRTDVFVRDLVSGTTARVSVGADEEESDGWSYLSAISADGRHVVFVSLATNLVAGITAPDQAYARDRDPDGNGVFDESSATTLLVSRNDAGDPADDAIREIDVSGDGRFIAFTTNATNLDARVTDASVRHLYLHDRDPDGNGVLDEGNATTTLVSVTAGGEPGDGYSSTPRLSADGKLLAFSSYSDNFHSDAGESYEAVYLHSHAAGGFYQVQKRANLPALAADGEWLAYATAEDLVLEDANGVTDVYVERLADGAVTRVSVASDGAEGDSVSASSAISADGRFVAFGSFASNFTTEDTSAGEQVYRRDRDTDGDGLFDEALAVETTLESRNDAGEAADEPAWLQGISRDGSLVAFDCKANNLVADATSTYWDVFARDHCPASWENYGSGLAGLFGVPGLTVASDPILGSTLTLSVESSQGMDSFGLLFLGFAKTSVPAFGGELLVTPSLILPLFLPGPGLDLDGEIPDDPTLCGLHAYLQVFQLDPAASRGISMTPGLDLGFGRR